MKRNLNGTWMGLVCLLCVFCVSGLQAQERTTQGDQPGKQRGQQVGADPDAPNRAVRAPSETVPQLVVPRLVKFSGIAKDEIGKPRTGTVGITLAIYKEPVEGAPLWLETQNVELDEQGRYTVLLGATQNEGLPLGLFTAGEQRWLGVRVNQPEEMEQPRVLLVSVPYALKAADADTVGGMPASAFALAGTATQTSGNPKTGAKTTTSGKTAVAPAIGGGGTPNVVTKFDGTGANVINSSISDDGSRITVGEGINFNSDFSFVGNAEPARTGRVQMFDRANVGFVIRGLNVLMETLQGSSFVPTEVMRWTQAGNVGIGTSAPGQKLEVAGNVKISGGGNALVFPDGSVMSSAATGVGGGTITGVTAGAGLSGGGTTGGVTLSVPNGGITNSMLAANAITNTNIADGSLAPAKIAGTAATLGLNNFAGNQVVNGDLTISNPTSVNSENVLHVVGNNGSQTTVKIEAAQPFLVLNNTTSNTRLIGIGFTSSSQALPNTWTIEADPGGFNADKLDFIDKNGVQRLELNGDAGTAAISASTSISGNLALPNTASSSVGVLTLGGTPFLHNFGTGNTFVGASAGNMTMTGQFNTAVGSSALLSNTTGNTNSAFGAGALQLNTIGLRNSAFGFDALLSNTTGMQNSAFGSGALQNLTSGDLNTAIGAGAGNSLTSGSSNVYIANSGAGSESNTIRVGTVGTQMTTFIAGISGATSASGVAVFVNSSGQLGTTTSSRRFKHEIADMGGESDLLMKLRPVAFYYKPELDETQTRQYGLVAEEVAQVAPQLVVFDKDGTPQTVRYHFVNAMLLNEVQKQWTIIESQESKIQNLEARLARLETTIAGR
jgi:hypothetical protein